MYYDLYVHVKKHICMYVCIFERNRYRVKPRNAKREVLRDHSNIYFSVRTVEKGSVFAA